MPLGQPHSDTKAAFSGAIENQSQTRTWRARVLDANTIDGTCLVRVSGGSVERARVPIGVSVAYNSEVFVERIPGSNMLVVSNSGVAADAQAQAVVPAGSVAMGLEPHELDSIYHLGQLHDAQAPQFLKIDGSRDLEGNLGVDPGITIDGVDISEMAAGIARNNIVLFKDGTRTGYDATQAGLVAALAAALPRSAVRLPSREITMTAGITVPEGVALTGLSKKAYLNFSGFNGTAITMALDAVCHGFSVKFVSNGANAIGINGHYPGTLISDCPVSVKGGTVLNHGIWTGED